MYTGKISWPSVPTLKFLLTLPLFWAITSALANTFISSFTSKVNILSDKIKLTVEWLLLKRGLFGLGETKHTLWTVSIA